MKNPMRSWGYEDFNRLMSWKVRLYVWFFKLWLARISKGSSAHFQLIVSTLRLDILPLDSSYSITRATDLAVDAACLLIGRDDVQSNEELDQIVANAKDHDQIPSFVSSYHLIWAFYYSQLPSDDSIEKKNHHLRLARQADPEAKEIDRKKYNELYASSKALRKEQSRQVRRLNARHIRNTAEAEIDRIEVTTSDLTALISIVSVMIVVGGYLYNRLLLGYFGVDVALFLSIGDYASTSVDQLSIALVATALGLVFLMYGKWDSLLERVSEDQTGRTPTFGATWWNNRIFFLSILLSGIASASVIWTGKMLWIPVLVLAYFVVIAGILRFPLERWVINPNLLRLAILAIAAFVAQIIFRVVSDVERIEAPETANDIVIVPDPIPEAFEQTDWRLITASGDYYFFYSPDAEKTIVVPRRDEAIFLGESSSQQ